MRPPPDIEDALRTFFRGIATGDLAAIRSVCLPHPDIATLGTMRLPADQLKSLPDQLDDLQPHVQARTDSALTARAHFRGMLFPVAFRRAAGAWRIDPRWWIAGRRGPTEAERTARAFMLALMAADREGLAQFALPDPGLDLLLGPAPPAGELAQLVHVAENLPVIELAPGEEYPGPGGAPAAVRPDQVADDRKLLLMDYNGTPLPLPARRTDGRWRIDPSLVIALAARDAGRGP